MTATQRDTAGAPAVRPQPGDYIPGVGVVIADLARPPGYDTAPAPLREAFDAEWQRSETAHRAYLDAFDAAGKRHTSKVRRLFGKHTGAYASMSAARDALTDPVQIAVETLLSISARGLPDNHRDEVRVIAMRARRALAGVPVTAAEAEEFRASLPERAHDQPDQRTPGCAPASATDDHARRGPAPRPGRGRTADRAGKHDAEDYQPGFTARWVAAAADGNPNEPQDDAAEAAGEDTHD